MFKYAHRYIRQTINGDQWKKDFNNLFRLVSQRPYKGKMNDKGEVLTPAGVMATVQIIEDLSAPAIDKETGEIMEDNSLENVEVTIIGASYPLPLQKGDLVSLGNFIPELSYYVNYNLILRFDGIEKVEK